MKSIKRSKSSAIANSPDGRRPETASLLERIGELAISLLPPRPKITGAEWADQYRIVAAGTSPEPGPWRTARVPYLREPLEAATSHSIEKVVIMAASQIAKSEMLVCVLGYYIDQEPCSIMMVQPTVEAAESFSKERIDPNLMATPVLKSRMQAMPVDDERGRSRKSTSTIRMKHFTGGYLAMVGSNSPAGLASRPIRVLLCDEIDRFGSTQEGDPLKLAVQRTTNFSNRKIVFVSTPTTEVRADGPTIYSEFMASDQREYMVLCPHCGKRFAMVWEHVKWDKDEDGDIIEDSIRMECPHCSQKVRGNDKPDPYLLASGIWEPKNPSCPVRGYHLTSLCSPWVRLSDLVHEWNTANHNRNKQGLQEFINLKLGEPWREDEADLSLWEKLSERREWYPESGTLPSGVLFLTCGIDVQHDRLEASVYGWGKGWESWGVRHQVIMGDPFQADVWTRLDILLMTQFPTQDGRILRIACAFVDSGDGNLTARVYEYTKAREKSGVYPIKGASTKGKPLAERSSNKNSHRVWLFIIGTDAGKRLIMQRLAVQDVGPAFVHYPRQPDAGFNEDFFQQLTAEVFERRFEKGRLTEGWKKIRERNEALDCAVYATAAAHILSPNFDILQAQAQAGIAPVAAQPRKRKIYSRGVEI